MGTRQRKARATPLRGCNRAQERSTSSRVLICMSGNGTIEAYVIKAQELPALNDLPTDFPRPRRLEWINRGTDQRLRRSTIEMLMRTLFRDCETPSVARLHSSSGLRLIFACRSERARFARAFEQARKNSPVRR